MVDNPTKKEKTLVVIDAGVATEDNLKLLKDRGYNYLCVSRVKPKNYTLSEDCRSVTVFDSRKREITLREVSTSPEGDSFLEVTSPSKAMTEASMNRQWRKRFEEELEKINAGIGKRGGVKKYDKVVEHVGRAMQRYPSIAKYYDISYRRDTGNPDNMGEVLWSIKDLSCIESGHGVYFLRSNIKTIDEKRTWEYYNIIRDIECTNRQLKTDLPIYHQKDSRSDALGYKKAPFRKMEICRTQRPPD